MKATMTINELRAALLAAGKKDVRYYLNGVLCDVREGVDGALLVASDNHRVHAVLTGALSDTPRECGSAIIPRDAIEQIAKSAKRTALVSVECEGDTMTLTRDDGISVRTAPVDGKFPDYQRVIPKRRGSAVDGDTSPGQFNPRYLADFQKAAELLGQRVAVTVRHNGPHSAAEMCAGFGIGLYGVVMPIRNDAPEPETTPVYRALVGA